ncbi:MAG: type II toxin-antitoxin system RelE/ParE family toxin [Deltaproteobacteria bacterium]|nr:type II toxin-antitoxin system RelE/ParE family toxin [Deltaproteobacteria bacterium]
MSHSTAPMTIRLPVELKERLDKLAQATKRSRSWLTQDAVRTYLELQEWQVSEIEGGVKPTRGSSPATARSTPCDDAGRAMRTRWTQKALSSLEAQAAYIGEHDPIAAGVVVDRVMRGVDLLLEHPAMGRPGRVAKTRELVISGTPYIVAYRVRGEWLEILHVLHAARRWPDDF